MYVKSEKGQAGRPKNLEATEVKTWRIYSEDVTTALNNDWQPKHVFRMGIKALKQNPEILNKINASQEEYKTLSERVYRIAKALDMQCQKNEQLEKKLVELGVKLDDVQ